MIIEKTLLICPVCSRSLEDSGFRTVKYPTDLSRNSFLSKPHSILFCSSCGVGVAFPKLSDEQLLEFYSQSGYWNNSRVEVLLPRKFPGHYALSTARWRIIKPVIKKITKAISMLDIGAGQGFLGMVAAKDREICLDSYYIVEKDNVLRESLKKTWHKGYPKIKLKVEDSLEAIEGQFDIIILSNVLEHLYRPKDMLEKAVEKLAEGGYIFADLPNQDYLFKLDVFPHLTFFNKLSLQMLFEKSGLSLQQIACYGRDMQGSPAGRGKNRVIFKILENLFYKLRFFIPVCISKRFYQWYYGTVTNNPQGTWIRALGKRSRGVNESSNHY